MRFHTTIELHGKSATGIPVPSDVVEALGHGKKPPVTITVNGYSYRSSVAVMGGRFLVSLSAENRAAAGVAAGDEIDVDIEHDDQPRVVTLPPDLAAALSAEPALEVTFRALSYSQQLQHVLAIDGAKTAETRQRRLDGVLAKLRG